MNRRKAILHIGTMNTGGTSIQATLGQNPVWLSQRNFTFLAGSQRTPEQVDRRVNSIKKDSNLIISDEGLWHFANSDRSNTSEIAKVLKDFNVTVLVYFRRPDEFLESWFIQGLKHGKGAASFKSFETSAFVREGCNFLGRLQIFSDLFGKEAIRVFPYERVQLTQGDCAIDFLARIGLASVHDTHESLASSGLIWPDTQNVSPDPNIILLVSLLRQLGNVPEGVLRKVLQSASPAHNPTIQLLWPKERDAIKARYREVFRELQRSYGGGASDNFFLNWQSSEKAQTSIIRPFYDQFHNEAKGASTVQNSAPPLRVAFVIQKLAGLSGGAERVFIETAEAMAARGMAVRILSFDTKPLVKPIYGRGTVPMLSLFPGQSSKNDFKAEDETKPRRAGRAERLLKALPNRFPLSHLKWMTSHGLFSAMLRRHLQQAPADVIVAFLPPAITAAVRAGKNLQIPVVASTHNMPSRDFDDGPRWDQNPLYRQRAREALKDAAQVTVLLPEFVKWFPQEVQARVVVLPNPVSRLAPSPMPDIPRETIILGVGRQTRIKRWDMLIAAFAQVAEQLPGWHLRLFGAGPERNALAAQIEDLGLNRRAEILEPTSKISAEYDRASILAHPSEFEGFGLSVAEAMAHGLAVVAYEDCPGVRSLIQNRQNGLLLARPSENEAIKHLADALLELGQDRGLCDKLGQAATMITSRFNSVHLYDRWAMMLQKVAKQ